MIRSDSRLFIANALRLLVLVTGAIGLRTVLLARADVLVINCHCFADFGAKSIVIIGTRALVSFEFAAQAKW